MPVAQTGRTEEGAPVTADRVRENASRRRAVVRHVRESSSTPLVVWIAQTDELCEQAAEAWSYVWRAVGVPGVRLTMSRLWGQNEATDLLEGMHLVIATDDKLDSVRKRGGYDWLTDAGIVIVDEAHTSVSKSIHRTFRLVQTRNPRTKPTSHRSFGNSVPRQQRGADNAAGTAIRLELDHRWRVRIGGSAQVPAGPQDPRPGEAPGT